MYLVIIIFIAFEIIFQVKPEFVPAQLMMYLPKNTIEKIRIAVAHKWGYYTGQDMIFHYPPSRQMNYGELIRPHVHIDEEGFRNPSQNSDNYDVVLLGDSMIFALDAKQDLADRFRKTGYAAINLGMEGYAPQQYRDVYKHYVIERNIKHDYVFIFLYIGNDFQDAEAYQNILDKNGDYTDYVIGETKSIPYLPLILNVTRGIYQNLWNNTAINEPSIEEQEKTINRMIHLPYKKLEVDDSFWPPPAINHENIQWTYVKEAIDDLAALADQVGATPLFFLLPSPLTVYSDYEIDSPINNSLRKYDRRHATSSQLLKQYFESKNLVFTDLNEPLKAEIEQTFIFASEDDGHFSDAGLDKVFELVQETMPLKEGGSKINILN